MATRLPRGIAAHMLARSMNPAGPDDLSYLSQTRLRAMLRASEAIGSAVGEMAAKGSHPVAEALRGAANFALEAHYPDGDVFDVESGAQYYYHAHRADTPEHGHFHSFARRGDGPSHLVAVSMDSWGQPLALFTVNRWVTGDTWRPAAAVCSLLDGFRFAEQTPLSQWLSAILVLYRPDIEGLIEARDVVIDKRRRERPGDDVLEDRGLEVTARIAINHERQVRRVQRTLGT